MENAGKKIEDIGVEKAKELVIEKTEAEFILLDVRQPEEYRSGHIPGAVFIPLPELTGRIVELDPSKSILVYCRSGNRSRAAATLLLNDCFTKVFNLAGGIMAWNGRIATGAYAEGLVLLEGRQTAEELISLAVALEEGSRIFYSKVAELTTDREARDMLASLAEAESRHKAKVLEGYRLAAGEDYSEDVIKKECETGIMESGIRIDDMIGFLKEPGKTIVDILELSMQVETNALDLYMKISREITDANAKKVFEILIEEEKQHLSKLGKLLGSKVAG